MTRLATHPARSLPDPAIGPTLEFGRVLRFDERGFGFLDRTFSSRESDASDVFFHIRTLRRTHRALADEVDSGRIDDVWLWYVVEGPSNRREATAFVATDELRSQHAEACERYADEIRTSATATATAVRVPPALLRAAEALLSPDELAQLRTPKPTTTSKASAARKKESAAKATKASAKATKAPAKAAKAPAKPAKAPAKAAKAPATTAKTPAKATKASATTAKVTAKAAKAPTTTAKDPAKATTATRAAEPVTELSAMDAEEQAWWDLGHSDDLEWLDAPPPFSESGPGIGPNEPWHDPMAGESRPTRSFDARRIADEVSDLTPAERKEFARLVQELGPLGFRTSSELSRHIVRHKLGNQYRHLCGVVTLRNGEREWDFPGGFPPRIFRLVCLALEISSRESKAEFIGFRSFTDEELKRGKK